MEFGKFLDFFGMDKIWRGDLPRRRHFSSTGVSITMDAMGNKKTPPGQYLYVNNNDNNNSKLYTKVEIIHNIKISDYSIWEYKNNFQYF